MIKKCGRILPPLLFVAMLLGCMALSVYFLLSGKDWIDSDAGPSLHTLVIDPGHGGIDGGAVAGDGTKESDLNLSISLKLHCLSELLGQPVCMTRSDDSSRTDYESYSEHEDLVFRTETVNDLPGAILISIHQNCFPTGQPSGSQVLYAVGPESELLGKLMHENLIRNLDPQNRRVAEPAPKNLYITSHVNCPAVLVECGFMSNVFDVQKLKTESYQCAVAAILAASLLQYLNSEQEI